MIVRRSLRAYPASYWDSLAPQWDAVVADRGNPHQFYYYEADRCISRILARHMRVLELGCGTGGGTRVHATEVSRLVAIDASCEMARRARQVLRAFRGRGHVDFVVADAAHLPFRPRVFDAVVSRGVALSYVANPRDALAETRRVLRRGGKLGIDVMNYQRNWSSPARAFSKVGQEGVYMETRVVAGRQVRRIYHLSEDCPYLRRTRRAAHPTYTKSIRRRPRWLGKYVRSMETREAWMFKPKEVARLASRTGFRKVVIIPLGLLPRVLSSKDRGLKAFATTHKNALSNLFLFLVEHWRPEFALHLFVDATRA